MQHHVGRSPTPRRSAPTAAPAGPRPPRPWSGPSTCSPPRSAATRRSVRPATCSPGSDEPFDDRRRHHLRHRRLRRAPWTAALEAARLRRPCGPSRPGRRAARRPGRHWASACRCYVEVTAGPSPGDEYGEVVSATPTASVTVYTGIVAPRPGPRTPPSPMIASDAPGIPLEADPRGPRRHRPRGRRARAPSGPARCSSAASAVLRGRRRGRRRRPSGRRPPCWRRRSTTSCSTPTRGAFHVAGAPAGGRSAGPTSARRRRRARRAGRRLDFERQSPHASRSGPTWPSSRSTPRPAWCGCAGMRRRATTPAASSTRCWPRASATAASPRASPRPCYEEVRYDADGNPQTTNLADYAIVGRRAARAFELVHPGDADAGQPPWGQGHRRGGRHRVHAGGAEARCATPCAHLGVAPRRHARARPERVWGAIQEGPVSEDLLGGQRRQRSDADVEPSWALLTWTTCGTRLTAAGHQRRGATPRRAGRAPVHLDGRLGEVVHRPAPCRPTGRRSRPSRASAGRRRCTPPRPPLPGLPRVAVRVLHAGHGDGRRRPAGVGERDRRGVGRGGAGRQPLPLHRLPQHRRNGAAGAPSRRDPRGVRLRAATAAPSTGPIDLLARHGDDAELLAGGATCCCR